MPLMLLRASNELHPLPSLQYCTADHRHSITSLYPDCPWAVAAPPGPGEVGGRGGGVRRLDNELQLQKRKMSVQLGEAQRARRSPRGPEVRHRPLPAMQCHSAAVPHWHTLLAGWLCGQLLR